MRPKTYEPEEIAKRIAFEGHSSKHKRDFERHLNIKDRSELEKHILLVLKDKNTRVFQTADKRDIYYHRKSNTFISVDLTNKHGGSCFLPLKKERPTGIKYFVKQYKYDKNLRKEKNHGIKQAIMKKGGFDALYEGKKIDKRAKIKYAREAQKIDTFKKISRFKENKLDISKHKENEKKLVTKQKRDLLAELAKKEKAINDNKTRLEAEKNKQINLARLQQAKNDRIKEEAKQAELKRKQEKLVQDEQERQGQREARLRALEEARKKAMESAYSINKNDITKKF